MLLQQIAAQTFNLSFAVLGSEVPLSPNVEVGPAAYAQTPISAASNGGDFLALWRSDERFDRPPVLHLGRIAADGTPRIAFPRSFPSPSSGYPADPSALLAANGEEYLLAFISGTTAYVQRVGDDGEPLDAARAVSSASRSVRVNGLVFNGSVFLLLVSGGSRTEAFLLDRDGAVAAVLQPFHFEIVWAGVQNGEFVVVDHTFTGEYALHRFAAFGTRTDIPLPMDPPNIVVAVAASADRFLFAHDGLNQDWVSIRDSAGRVLSQQTPCPKPDHYRPSAWWDGAQFVTGCMYAGGQLWATRFNSDGAKLGTTQLSTTAAGVAQYATNGGTHLVLWPDRAFSKSNDLVTRAVSGSDSVAPGAELQLVSYSGRAQRAVRIARAGGHRAAIWADDTRTRVETVIDGKTVSIESSAIWGGRPAIAAGERTFLAVWADGDAPRLLARRIGLSGQVFDGLPVAFGRNTDVADAPPGVAFRAPLFVIALPSYGDAMTAGVTEDGARVVPAPPAPSPRYAAVQPFWERGELRYGVALLEGGLHYSPGIITYYWGFSVARPGAEPATVIRSREFSQTEASKVAIAPGADRLMFAWIEGGTVVVAQHSLDGARVLSGPLIIGGESNATEIDALWTGSEYVVAWSGRVDGEVTRRIRAMRLDANGQPIDPAPMAISPPGATADKPALAATSFGVDIAYSRYDQSNGGAPRAYVRSFERVPARRRSTRH